MDQTERPTSRLPAAWRLLAWAMRRMPTDIRRVDMLWHRLYVGIGGGRYEDDPAIDAAWPSGLQPPTYLPRLGALMELDLGFWNERRSYFAGSYYQDDLIRLLKALLRPGEQYIDVGANIGATALCAGVLVGPSGRCLAFEPNPVAFDRLRRHLEVNGLQGRVEAHPVAIAAGESEARLVLAGENMGLGTLAPRAGASGPSYSVRTVPGDSFAGRLDPGVPTVVKIDVEGYEVQVLEGMGKVLELPEVAVIAEVNESMLRDAGHSEAALLDRFRGAGFVAHTFGIETGRWSKRLRLESFDGPRDEPQYDALFTKPGSRLHRQRVAPLLG